MKRLRIVLFAIAGFPLISLSLAMGQPARSGALGNSKKPDPAAASALAAAPAKSIAAPAKAIAAASSASDSESPSKPLVLEFWHSMAGRQQQIVLDLVEAFNKANPGIRIVPVYQGSYDSLSQKLVASCMSGSNPAASQMYESWTTRFMNRNLISPVEDLAAEAAASAPVLEKAQGSGDQASGFEDILRAFREDNTWNVQGKPKLMTLPFNKSIYVLYVNEERMREAGYEQPPKDWDEWKEMAQKMTVRDASGNVKVYGFATRPLIESFTINLFLNGCKYIDENGEFDFASDKGLEALSFLVEMTHGKNRSGYVETDYLNTAFGSGKIAMYAGSTASFPYNEQAVAGRFTWRAYPLPYPKGRPGRCLCQGTNVGVFSNHPKQVQLAAYRFLEFMCNTENTVKWAMETGYLPVRYSALKHPKMKAYIDEHVNYLNALSRIDDGLFEPREIYWESIRLALAREVESALMGRKSPQKALNTALAKANYIRNTE